MFKKLNKKGFTLAELLVVVAIIGVLVAISIPIFTGQLEKARDAVSIANIRAAYAEASTQYLTGTDASGAAITGNEVKINGVDFKGTVKGWSGLDAELPFTHTALTEELGADAKKHNLTFSFGTDGACTLNKVEVA